MNYKPENRIPWLLTDFDKFSFFPDFSLTVATLHTVGEIKTGNARFHALIVFDLHSFDRNILSFENILF